MVGARSDPYLGFNFLVEIKDIVVAGFSEITGLEAETEVHSYREGGENRFMHKFAGPTNFPSNLVLNHGITDTPELWDWCERVRNGTVDRKSVSVILRDRFGNEAWRWNFRDAYPIKWIGPQLRAATAEVAIETLELVHRGMSSG